MYVSNKDKSFPEAVYRHVVAQLKASAHINDNRIAAQLQLQREPGAGVEEGGWLQVPAGTCSDAGRKGVHSARNKRGGRERITPHVSAEAKEEIVYAKSVVSGGNTIPNDMTERQWEGYFYKTLRFHGLSQDSCGASSHGLRRAYAQARYEQITGFEPRCKFDSPESFRASAAERTAGDDWSQADQDDVMAQYLGSKC